MAEETVSKNFIEQEIDKDLAEGVYTEGLHKIPARAEWIPSYRTCKVYSFKFRTCERIRWNISFKI